MLFPNADKGVVEMVKLTDYCLNEFHPRGRHKARVFRSALGLERSHAQTLYDAILLAARTQDATLGEVDQYGQRYVLDFEMTGPAGSARVRTTWMIRTGEDFPRMTSCYVL
jgi:hypothetical protein